VYNVYKKVKVYVNWEFEYINDEMCNFSSQKDSQTFWSAFCTKI